MSVETPHIVGPEWKVAVPPRFEVKGELGRGGMAVVFRAYDKVGERDVALKFLPPSEDERMKKRFQREAADLAGVYHPNVVDFYSLGESEGHEFIEMEFVGGGTLTGFLSKCNSLKLVLQVYAQVAEGLHHIHENGLVHRDIKPANVLMTEDHIPKISDLGLARQQEGRTQLTQDGTVLGTAAYLAPEQLRSHAVDHRADLYALGTCLFEAVTNDKPFHVATPLAMLRAHLEEKPPVPSSIVPGLPERVDKLVLSLMEKKPEKRPQSAEEVAQELQAIVAELTPAQDKLVAATPSALLARAKMQLNLGEWQSALRVIENLELDDDQEIALELKVLKAETAVVGETPAAFKLAEQAVESCRESGEIKLLGSALVSLGEAARRGKKWESAESALQEARGIVPSSDKELQVRMLDALADLYSSGPFAEDPDSAEKVAQFRKIAAGLIKRSDSLQSRARPSDQQKSRTSTKSKSAAPKTVVMPAIAKNKIAIAAGVGALILVLGLFAVMNWWNNRPAEISIDSDPPGAAVLVNGERHYAPLQMELPKGDHTLKVFKQGYKPHEEVISLEAGGSFQLKATLQSASGQVKFTSKPDKVKIFIDGQNKGFTPLDLTGLEPKEYKVKAIKEGYIDYEGKVEVIAGQTRNLGINLKKVPPPPPAAPRYYPSSSGGGRKYTAPRSSPRRSQPRRRNRRGDGYFDAGPVRIKNPF